MSVQEVMSLIDSHFTLIKNTAKQKHVELIRIKQCLYLKREILGRLYVFLIFYLLY